MEDKMKRKKDMNIVNNNKPARKAEEGGRGKMLKAITTLHHKNRTWEIVKFEDHYMAIPEDCIENGRLSKRLNGVQTNASRDLNTCIRTTMLESDMQEATERTGSEVEAYMEVFGFTREQAEFFVNTLTGNAE
jgi:hypothetical protein